MIVGYRNEERGHIFCLRCYNIYIDNRDVPDNIKEEFKPISKEEDWAIDPSCTDCGKRIT